jgi:hypothetical protein
VRLYLKKKKKNQKTHKKGLVEWLKKKKESLCRRVASQTGLEGLGENLQSRPRALELGAKRQEGNGKVK